MKQNQDCNLGKYEVKTYGKNILNFNKCQIGGGGMHLQIIGWQFLFKFLLQGQLFSLYASECWDLFMLHNTKWWMQKQNAWGKSTVKLNSNIIVTVMSENSQCCYPQTLLRLKTCFCFFFSFNKFEMLKYIAPSHSFTSSVWGQRYRR